MAKLINLLAHLRSRAMRPSFNGLWALLAFVLLQLGSTQLAQAQLPGSDFDHAGTGYVLNAQHQNVRCETCHTKGVFKGTPKDCVSCHGWNNPRATFSVMPTSHIPTGNASCESCHQANMAQFADATRTFNHTAVVSLTCVNCHSSQHPHPNVRTNPVDATHQAPVAKNQACDQCHTTIEFAGPKVPTNHIPTAAVACTNCHVNANYSAMPTITAIHANAQSSSNNCQQCHSAAGVSAYGMATMVPPLVGPISGHVAMNGQSCETCHVGGGSSLQLPVVDGAKFSGSSFNHQGITGGCASCHAANAVAGFGINNIIQMPSMSGFGPTAHIPTTAACEACHKSAPSGLMPSNAINTVPGSGFMSPPPTKADIHANVTASCSSCHGSDMSWLGVDQYPRTSSFTTIDANYIGFQSRPNTGGGYSIQDPLHPASGECSTCHSLATGFRAPTLPGNHIPVSVAAASSCGLCHKSGDFTTMPAITDIHANVKSGLSCADCHSTVNAAKYPMSPALVAPPVGHIAQGGLGCDSCHMGSNSSMQPGAVVNGANFANSAYVHSGSTTGCASCHGSGAATIFGVVPKNIDNLSPVHMPVTGVSTCETCHSTSGLTTQIPLTGATAGTASFAGAQFTHSGITATCASCHGQNIASGSFAGNPNIVVMPQSSATGPNSHIPTTAGCETCHTVIPSGLIAANASAGTGFKTSLPTKANIHANTTTGCSACHESGTWIGVDQYARTTTSPYASGTYFGFQVRPTLSGGLNAIQDPTPHPATGECSNCHVSYLGGFAAPGLPGGHIPVKSGCAACHKDPSYSVMPAIADIHANTTLTVCGSCHTNTTTYPMTPPIVVPSAGHIDQGSLDCQACHVGPNSSLNLPVANGASFAKSAYVHSSATTGCNTCHGTGTGAASLSVAPKNISNLSPRHLPITGGSACESCHKASPGTDQVPLTGALGGAPSFAGAIFNHSYTTASCASCHGQGISGASFAGSPNIVVMPSSAAPGLTSHIPSNASCEACHGSAYPSGEYVVTGTRASPSGFLALKPSPADIHANTSTACSTCHENGTWIGMTAYPRTSADYVRGVSGAYTGFQVRPTASGGLNSVKDTTPHPAAGECSNCHASYAGGFVGAVQPNGHIPTTTGACEACHKDPSYSAMPSLTDIHANVNVTVCAACHANNSPYTMTPAIKVPPPRHIAMGGLDCKDCHVGANSSMLSATVINGANFANSAYVHSSSATSCADCHGAGASTANLYGVTPKNIASLTPGHLSVTVAPACEACHAAPGSTQVPLTGAMGGTPTFAGATFNHNATNASCATCHGQGVSGANFAGNPNILVMPQSGVPSLSSHIPTAASCDACHGGAPTGVFDLGATKSIGASDFQLPIRRPSKDTLHNNVSVGCSSCHEAGMSWLGVDLYSRTTIFPSLSYVGFQTRPNLSGAAYSLADSAHPVAGECSSCHNVAGGFGAPGKPSGHIPITTAADANCSLCHKSPDYSVMPGTADIHKYASLTVCAQCHTAAAAVNYPMTPAIVVPPAGHIDQGTAGCEVCHVGSGSSMAATPVPDGAHFSGSLFNHSGATATCASCHGSGVSATGFYGVVPKAVSNLSPGHMPASDACETCHINSIPTGLVPSAGMKTFAGAQFSHAGITTGCDTCHGPSIVPGSFAGKPNIVVMPATSPFGASAHIPSSTTCESCHLGSTPTGLVAGSASKVTGPGTGFQSPAPTSSMIHSNVTGNCASCHGDGQSWIGVGIYPGTPAGYVAHANYTGFQTRPGAGGLYAVKDPSHPGAGIDCSQCHSSFASFGPPTMPAGHIPVAPTAQCGNCHTSNFVDAPTVTNIHAFAQSTTANCVQCHSVASAAQFTVRTPIVTPDGNHIPMGSLSCESCHMGAQSSIRGAAVKTGDKFAGSLFNHSGIATGCNACHGVTVDATTFPGIPNIKAISYDIAPVHMRVPSAIGCEVCHTNSVPVGQVPAAGMKTFAGASFTHSGITTDCAKCHGPGITPASFLGSPNIVVMPATVSGGHIPSSTVCESCHLGSTPSALIAGSATKTTGPGTGFKVALPASSTIHANSDTTSCNVCHESGKDWISVNVYTRGPSNTPSPGVLFTGFQTRPVAGGGTYSVTDSAHVGVGVGDCSNCHTGYTGFGPPTAPANHIPYVTGTSCGSCHTVADFAVMPTYANIHKYAQSATTNCVQCHSTANADIYNQLAGMGGKLVKPATNHIAMGSLSCESCHVDSLTGLTSSNTSFAGGKYSHSGVTTGCNACHVSGTGPFQGTLSIVVMPPTTGPAASTQHLPTSTTCETCHLGSTPSTLLSAVATNTAATSSFATPVPTAAMNHTGVSASCNACHEAGGSSTSDVWMNMAAYPITTAAPYKGFQTRPSTAGTFRVADAAHPAAGDCSACHSSFTDFSSTAKPANHIPTASTATCQNCHTTSDYSLMPSLTNIHLYAPSTTNNCVQCHSATNADTYNQLAGMAGKLIKPPATHVPMGALGCESCHVGSGGVASSINVALPVRNGANFANSAYSHSGVTSGCANCHGDGVTALSFAGQTPKPIPAGHVPNAGGVDCVACHTTVPGVLIAYTGAVAGSANTFETTKYSHSGITASCQTCHAGGTSYVGITNMVVLSAFSTHIPTTTKPDCASCHLGSTPTALTTWIKGAVPKVAPNTGFKLPIPTGAMIHTNVTSGCVSCHEAGMSWLEVDTSFYPRTPTVKTVGANYLGFNTRPFLNGTGYSINDGNHPTGTTDCSNCHGSTSSFSVSAVPANHIPYSATATCANCHTQIDLVGGTADFSKVPTVANIHAYAPSTTVNCAQCHSAANAAKYNAGGVVIKSPASIAKHVPYGTVACEVCHVGLSPVIDTSKFAGGKYSHTGVTTGCATCHGNGLLATNFTGISNLVAIPATAAMGATAHIPYTAACEACHAGSTPSALLAVTGTPAAVSGFRLPAPTGTMIHTGISSGCNACHDSNYVWKGVDLYPINPSTVTANGSYKGFQTRPLAAPTTTALGKFGITDSAHPLTGDCSQCHGSTTAFTGVDKPAGHMPTTTPTCITCHSPTDYSVAGLGTLTALHTGITYQTTIKAATAATMAAKLCSKCHTVGTGGTSGTAPFTGCTTSSVANCASPPAMNTYQPATVALHPTHVPIGASDCNACHVSVSSFAGVNMKNATMHTSVNSIAGVTCMSCHERGLAFYGVAVLKVRPSGHHTGQDCGNSGCHTYNGGFKALVKPVMRGALVNPNMSRIKPTTQTNKPTRGSLGNTFDHKGVAVGKCKDCHDGKSASGMPARHLMVTTSCDSCHRPTTWLPAQFNHSGVSPNTCQACHNGMGASAKPSGHFMTPRSCDSCHKNMSWKPVNYQHLSPQYRPSPDKLTCVSCHVTNGEMIPRQMRGLTRTKPIPVGP